MTKCFVTVGALIRCGRAVCSFMFLKMGLLSEAFVADHTLKWSFT